MVLIVADACVSNVCSSTKESKLNDWQHQAADEWAVEPGLQVELNSQV
jgi:hypothetical protein